MASITQQSHGLVVVFANNNALNDMRSILKDIDFHTFQ